MPRADHASEPSDEAIDRERHFIRRLGALGDDLGRCPTVLEAMAATGLSRSNSYHYLSIARRAFAWTTPTTERLRDLLEPRTIEQRQRLVGHALAQTLGISQSTGEDIVARLAHLQALGLKETHLLLMLDARRKGDPPPEPTPPPPVVLALHRSKRTALLRIHSNQLSML